MTDISKTYQNIIDPLDNTGTLHLEQKVGGNKK